MDYDENKTDEAVLALLLFNTDSEGRAWKSLPWEVMDRLHKKGFISNPASKNKSVVLSEEGEELAHTLFKKLFAKTDESETMG